MGTYRIRKKEVLPDYLVKARKEEDARRMAGERLKEEKLMGEIDRLVKDVQKDRQPDRDKALVADAQAYLLDRRDSFINQGISPEKALLVARALDGLNHLPGDPRAPRELRTHPKPGMEKRLHTKYDGVNPISGQQDISLVLDPVTGRPMVTNLGKVGEGLTLSDVDGYQHATEYVQQQLGRLAGFPIVANNIDDVHAPDFKAAGLIIDGETTRPAWNDPAIQTHTKVMDKGSPKANKYGMAASVERKLRRFIKNNPGVNIRGVVSEAPGLWGGRGRYGEDMDPMLGKLYDGSKDAIIVTELSNKNHARNRYGDVHADPLVGAYYQDMRTAQDIIEGYTGQELADALQVRPNDGHRNSRNRDPRGRVYIEPNADDNKIINQEFRKVAPITGQLFDYEY